MSVSPYSKKEYKCTIIYHECPQFICSPSVTAQLYRLLNLFDFKLPLVSFSSKFCALSVWNCQFINLMQKECSKCEDKGEISFACLPVHAQLLSQIDPKLFVSD